MQSVTFPFLLVAGCTREPHGRSIQAGSSHFQVKVGGKEVPRKLKYPVLTFSEQKKWKFQMLKLLFKYSNSLLYLNVVKR